MCERKGLIMKPSIAIWKSKLLLLIIIALSWQTAMSIRFLGTENTFARYEEWNRTVNGTLKFEFKTERRDALLLYTDDGGTGSKFFLELVLENAQLQLRFRIRNKARTIIIGEELSSNTWHKVTLMKSPEECVIILNGERKSGAIPDGQASLTGSSDLFIGGVPRILPLTYISHPEVKFLNRFEGHVRNLVYLVSERPKRWYRPESMAANGIDEDPSDLCGSDDFCRNQGLCVSSDADAECDCSGTGYTGLTCETPLIPQTQSEEAPDEKEGKTATSATFDGNTYISYSLIKKKISNNRDEVLFEFRTQSPAGLILSVGEEYDYIYAAMNGGRIEIAINLGSGEYREFITARRGQSGFIDNEWHKVRITRENTEVTIRVDESIMATGNTEGDFMRLGATREFLVGGAANPELVPGYREVSQNFRGNLRDVVYNGEDFMLELLELAISGDDFTQVFGDITFTTEDVDAIDPITFLSEESFLLLPKWMAKTEGTLSLSFRTNEPSGVIMYNRGADHITDFFALELMDGYLHLILDLGSGSIRYRADSLPLNDGLWHSVLLYRHHNRGTLQIDNEDPGKFNVGGTSKHLNLVDHLVLGGIDFVNDSNFLPMDLYSGALRRGYVGCLKNLVLQGTSIDLPSYALRQHTGNEIGVYCRDEEGQCPSTPCSHEGTCTEGWNRYICDCRITGYTGKTCDEEVARLSFNGNQYMRITVSANSRSKVEDIFLRFRTRFPDGLLVATSSDNVIDMLMVEVKQGLIRVITNYGIGQTMITAGHGLDDNRWHAVHVQRRDDRLMVTVDNTDRAEAFNITYGVSENFQSGILDYHYIEVGGVANRESMPDNPLNFVGHMEQFLYNNQPYFDMAKARDLDYIRLNATFGEKMSQRPKVNPFTFRTKEVFVQLETPDSYPALTLFFHFKTTESNGLLLYSSGGRTDFISVGLVEGQIQYAFNMGAGPVKIHANTPHMLNDNKWHEVSVSKNSGGRHVLQVDNSMSIAQPSPKARHLDLTENLYVGGVSTDMYEDLQSGVEARVGFQGCFASLEVNGRKQDLEDSAISIEMDKSNLKRGCEDNGDLCLADVCANGGLCIPGWNGYSCDCRMTSFSGVNCSGVSTSFGYGTGGGVISLEIPESQWLRTDHDDLSMGMATRSANAIIARIDSATSDDYIEMELVNGYLWTMYNFGSADHMISDDTNRINDGSYHVIHFSRTGANASLQIDQYARIHKTPKGKQSTFFDDQAIINLGGRGEMSDSKRKRRRRAPASSQFEGMMSGLSYNDMRVLDMAASDDPRVVLSGNVGELENPENYIYGTPIPTTSDESTIYRITTTRKTPVLPPILNVSSTANSDLTSPTKITMSIAPTSDGEYTPDDQDIIFVTGSGCMSDVPEDCTPQAAGEDIFVPGETMSTPPPDKPGAPVTTESASPMSPQPLPPSSTEPGSGCDDDDEDCMTASGENSGTKPSPTKDFTFTPVDATGVTVAGSTPQSGASQGNNGFDFLGEAGLVVGAVSAAAVIFILVILAIYKFKNRNEGSYQINESRNYDYEATRTSLLPATATNGTLPSKPKPSLPPEYATKEWYV
ncbi:neurexin-3-like isoform X2 [Strongylocentrotus purpuratus]|uniref:Uncharacterized protein n=1 Tax=Strongylocentrotus purpuratus TaxID=7668 RepID=A0A7M7NG04_STRPU|nr:neurexin-3 isoform X2 [Strongylocentrotus purpuratus]XP_030854254.1 neurexin-3-like isoform X2 [Strongylocentrotus purpuratus]|eukprot:XP_011667337.1 PREDICTED: neurexin-3 isoform X2 [Strongylocentrotus purpuratus]